MKNFDLWIDREEALKANWDDIVAMKRSSNMGEFQEDKKNQNTDAAIDAAWERNRVRNEY